MVYWERDSDLESTFEHPGGAMTERLKGKFIIFEGIDGSGITEQVELLREWLRHGGYDLNQVAFTHEPSEGPVGLLLRLTLQGRLDLDEETLALLFAADRRDHLNRYIRPRLEKGIHVVSDRYYLSFYAYQAGQGLSLEWLRFLGKAWTRPDLTLVLDTPLDQCLRNIERRFVRQRYETSNTLAKTWEQFRRLITILLSEGEEIKIINGEGTPQQVHRRVLDIVAPVFSGDGA